MSRSLKFARLLGAELRAATVGPVHGWFYRTTGRLDIGPVVVGLEIRIPWLFRDLKRCPPVAWCSEPWMKTGADWHNGPPLCWVIPHEWRDVMNWKRKPVRAIMAEGRQWFFKGVRCLVSRHYTAHLEGITTWPAEWESWGHDVEGIREYRRAKRSLSIRSWRQQEASNS